MREALGDPRLAAVSDVVLEYNLRRRGLRIDAVLLAPGMLVVIEFKRSTIGSADREQVMNYCINLREFHHLTRFHCEAGNLKIAPILALTSSDLRGQPRAVARVLDRPWEAILAEPLVCGPRHLS
ncbi:MAG: hypothetical protein ACF8LL_03085, partial [Phycisphaerales bacterium]